MRLTLQTDYALRLLIYLGSCEDERWVSIADAAAAYDISASHLTKTAQLLSRLGYIASKTGPGGGVRLAKQSEQIVVGKVIRDVEPSLAPVPCMNKNNPGACAIENACALKAALRKARNAFLQVLDDYTLQDCLGHPVTLRRLLSITPQRGR